MQTGCSCYPRPLGRSHGRWRPCWPPSTAASRTWFPERLLQIGGELRRGIEEVVADAGLSSYFQIRGRDCNLVYVARDQAGQPSQAFRTLVLQELIERGILAPSFVVCAAHDPAAIRQTIDAVSQRCRSTSVPWNPASIRYFAAGRSGPPTALADSDSEKGYPRAPSWCLPRGYRKSTADSSANCRSTRFRYSALRSVITCRTCAAWLSRSVNCLIS